MIEIKGKYNTAKIFIDTIEQETINQITDLLNQEFIDGSRVRIMPDTHAGKGCTIGTTMTIQDKIVPNLVGVDIGCGMICVELGNIHLEFSKLDEFIRTNIPFGYAINQHAQTDFKNSISNLICFRDLPKSAKEFNRALGSLGSGNHFIELNVDKNDVKYLVVHSGSRNLGKQVATYYQNKAYDYHNGLNEKYEDEKSKLINNYKKQGKRKEIQNALKQLQKEYIKESEIPKDLCYLKGKLMNDYLHDMKIVQQYANLNRELMAKRIIEECLNLQYEKLSKFQTIHNYIDLENMILRKGAISAKKNEKVIIPINMRDGSIIATGKGNEDWNESAPHGAGRLMSRSKAKQLLNINEYKESMKDVWTTSVRESTIDEAPMAYKPIEEIVENTKDTINIIDVIRPLYNFKS
ncbi:RtcB family protein [Tepidibacter aestuarii]|uniref:RtcB family protein n=1 Tax=Tepidibacter aestuarii TaxID=2925782 RepID=UPI0020BFEFBD|nr:RtcB family protein [Tepidibacter aestuarii]CAH2213260.1 tRNA-splicing ligase RtcB (3'-phosphate/5'-hydroxy nucleic acid ligase) [Tepidibacter aestuarii]